MRQLRSIPLAIAALSGLCLCFGFGLEESPLSGVAPQGPGIGVARSAAAPAAECVVSAAYASGAPSQPFPAAGASSTIELTVTEPCSITPVAPGWVSLQPLRINGLNSYRLTVSTNTSTTPRDGVITFGGQTLPVAQNAGTGQCTSYSLDPVTNASSPWGGDYVAQVTAPAGCGITPEANQPWVFVEFADPAATSQIRYTVEPNRGTAARTALLTLGNAVLTINQSAAQHGSVFCTSTAAVRIVRSEGTAEQTGDLYIDCTGTPSRDGLLVDLLLRTDYPITSRIVDPASNTTDVMLLLDNPSAEQQVLGTPMTTPPAYGTQYGNVYPGVQSSSDRIEFKGIPLFPQGGMLSSRKIRITNLRINVPAGGASEGAYANSVVAVTGIEPDRITALVNQVRRIGVVAPGLNASVVSRPVVWQCDPATPDAALGVRFTPGGPTDFRTLAGESGFIPNPALNIPGNPGAATQATRLMAKFTSIPAGVSLLAPQQVEWGNGRLQLVNVPFSDGSGGVLSTGAGTVAVNPVAGAANVVYEVTALNNDNLAAPVDVSFPLVWGPTSGTGTAKVSLQFAPSGSVPPEQTTKSVPRFGTALPVDAFTVRSCEGIPGCTYELSPSETPTLIPAAGGTASFQVVTPTGLSCPQAVRTEDSFLHVSQTAGGYSVAVDANAGPPRIGSVKVGDKVFLVRQQGAASAECSVVFEPRTATIPPTGGSGSVVATANYAACLTPPQGGDPSWVVVSYAPPGTTDRNVTISFSAGPNMGGHRYASFAVGNQSSSVHQHSQLNLGWYGSIGLPFDLLGAVGTPVYARLIISGGVPPYTISTLPNALPEGMTLYPSGVLV